jgi:hypothetical protein
METAELKKYIFNLVETNEDARILEVVYTLLAQNQQLQTPGWHQLDENEREAINEGVAQLERGEGIPHTEVLRKINARFGF